MENKLIEWVKKEKERMGLAYRDIAENSRGNISNVHTNEVMEYRQPISAKFVFAMSIAFNIPIWDAFHMSGMLPDEHEEIAELLIKYQKLPPDDKKVIQTQLDFLIYKNKIDG